PQLREYRRERSEKVENGTVNREMSVLSAIFRVQLEREALDFNPCVMLSRLPENQRDAYLGWEEFERLLKGSWWIHDILVTLYYTGMRFGEVVGLRWEMYKPDRRMLILPPEATKEGKSTKKSRLRPKRIPLRKEAFDLLESIRTGDEENVVRGMGLVFTYSGRYVNHGSTYHGKPITRSMIRKAWDAALRKADLQGLQVRDLRHTWKTNAQRSGMDPSIRNAIVGHSSNRSVEDRYIRISDDELLKAIDAMRFDNGWTELDLVDEG
ncbi:tyrosine-type recombinase/integrase, partial [Candidatus Micrarchaeota archaeon]|nr:tyrosine-type recombinase/integrase [Candidatus Micrarchaeota archaeon]